MTLQGIVVLDLLAFVLLCWVVNLVRRGSLYVGYGVIFLLLILSVMIVLSVPGVLAFVTIMVGAVFPASALTLLALCFTVFMLVYVLAQLTILSNRLAMVVQELAIRETSRQSGTNPDDR